MVAARAFELVSSSSGTSHSGPRELLIATSCPASAKSPVAVASIFPSRRSRRSCFASFQLLLSAAISSSTSSSVAAATFSSRCETEEVPGMGSIAAERPTCRRVREIIAAVVPFVHLLVRYHTLARQAQFLGVHR
jgi:hypothetical protein